MRSIRESATFNLIVDINEEIRKIQRIEVRAFYPILLFSYLFRANTKSGFILKPVIFHLN